MNHPTTTRVALTLALAAGTIAGCNSPTVTRQNNRDERVVSVQIDTNDFEQAAAVLTESMMQQGVFAEFREANNRKANLILDRYVNNTSQVINKNLLLRKVKATILNSGLAQPYGEGTKANERAEDNDFLNNVDTEAKYDYSLHLEIIETRATSANGRVQERTYTIQMTLLEYQTGAEVWLGEETVVKQRSR